MACNITNTDDLGGRYLTIPILGSRVEVKNAKCLETYTNKK
jgi:hypothetical protein